MTLSLGLHGRRRMYGRMRLSGIKLKCNLYLYFNELFRGRVKLGVGKGMTCSVGPCTGVSHSLTVRAFDGFINF